MSLYIMVGLNNCLAHLEQVSENMVMDIKIKHYNMMESKHTSLCSKSEM